MLAIRSKKNLFMLSIYITCMSKDVWESIDYSESFEEVALGLIQDKNKEVWLCRVKFGEVGEKVFTHYLTIHRTYESWKTTPKRYFVITCTTDRGKVVKNFVISIGKLPEKYLEVIKRTYKTDKVYTLNVRKKEVKTIDNEGILINYDSRKISDEGITFDAKLCKLIMPKDKFTSYALVLKYNTILHKNVKAVFLHSNIGRRRFQLRDKIAKIFGVPEEDVIFKNDLRLVL